MDKPVLYLMLGYPGAGKTTVAEIIERLTGAIRLTSDQERLKIFPQPQFTPQEHAALYKELDERTEQLLAAGRSVVYDANLNRYIHRKEKYDICERTGARPILFWIQTPKDVAKRRATELAENDKGRRPFGNLAVDVFDRLTLEIEPPHPDEPTVVLQGVDLTDRTVREKLGMS